MKQPSAILQAIDALDAARHASTYAHGPCPLCGKARITDEVGSLCLNGHMVFANGDQRPSTLTSKHVAVLLHQHVDDDYDDGEVQV